MKTPEFNKRLLVNLGLTETGAQTVVEHIEELKTEAGALRTEIICLKQDRADAFDSLRRIVAIWDGESEACADNSACAEKMAQIARQTLSSLQ